MNNYLYPPTQTSGFQNSSVQNNIPSTNNWIFPQPMQVQITTQLNANHNYQSIAKDFIEKFLTANSLGIGYTGHYYDNNTLFSIHVLQSSSGYLHEMIGFMNYRTKLTEMGIHTVKYNNILNTSQPIGKNSLLITMHGKAEINNSIYNISMTFVIKIISGTPTIISQIFNINI